MHKLNGTEWKDTCQVGCDAASFELQRRLFTLTVYHHHQLCVPLSLWKLNAANRSWTEMIKFNNLPSCAVSRWPLFSVCNPYYYILLESNTGMLPHPPSSDKTSSLSTPATWWICISFAFHLSFNCKLTKICFTLRWKLGYCSGKWLLPNKKGLLGVIFAAKPSFIFCQTNLLVSCVCKCGRRALQRGRLC